VVPQSLVPWSLFFYNLLMQFISISRRRTTEFPPEAFTPDLAARETQRVKALYASGILRQSGDEPTPPARSSSGKQTAKTKSRPL